MFRKTFKGLFILLMLLFVSGGLFGQNIQELRIGAPVSGNISRGGEYWYSIRAASNGLVTVRTMGDDVDTYMYAYNANREIIAENDDGDEEEDDLNARITIPVSANQTYYFKVRGYDSSETGSYRIVANTFSVTPLSFATQVSGRISSGGEYWYSVRPTRNGLLTVETKGNDVDTCMYAYDANGERLDEDDDSGQGYNARITIPASANQTYYFKVRGYDSDEVGPYSIEANFRAN
jgi:hypothetical protein